MIGKIAVLSSRVTISHLSYLVIIICMSFLHALIGMVYFVILMTFNPDFPSFP